MFIMEEKWRENLFSVDTFRQENVFLVSMCILKKKKRDGFVPW